ncbi:RNA polymerase factor sigma-54 [Martelella mediterranea]|uniref:RNA polymerase sigma-54 factor n=1 Tax=Martelella mediterranea TaxID=293089 RepID=A0A4V2V4U4_9HYPH|nr:RNA polymerase factor sigma-54 [Martelella mediterranea]TCT43022.1 RNA polymerase RpoN-/SigL-like sigma 54 subunit [Martelella mediterranea]
MALSASLFLRQNQSLVMTPQLMQSIQLLQMPYMELMQFIASEVEKNPLLEIESSEGRSLEEEVTPEPFSTDETATETGADWFSDDAGQPALSEQLDSNYNDAFNENAANERPDAPELLDQWKSMPGGARGEDHVDLDEFVAGQLCLRDHLNEQIALLIRDASDRAIATYLVDHLDEAGYFRGDNEEIAGRIGVAAERIATLLEQLKKLDPPGIFARTLNECLREQLHQKDRLDPAMAALIDHLDLAARRDFAKLKKLCGVDENDLIDMLRELRTLNPKPGSTFGYQPPEAVLPDVIVSAGKQGVWQVELNADTLPRVLVNRSYLSQVKANKGVSEADRTFMNTCLQNANWLTRSLDQRARTILKVATEIVRQQDAFLKHGVDHLRPLTLKTVAEAIDMHESTVSRVTSNKFMLTPRGLFELKYFFSVSIATSNADGGTHSAESVRHRIRQLITAETPESVLSDDDIVSALRQDGIALARRTVAKYREAMGIPSSVQRRREKRAMARAAEA